jgi:hypothetical protein
MALPTAYLSSTKNLEAILNAMQTAQAPKQFTHSFLQGLGFKASNDRLVIGVLKAIGFLDPSGVPTPRYFEFLDQSQSGRVLAEGVREAYADLYQLNTKAHELSRSDIKGKMKTLTQGQFSEAVLDKMVPTFFALAGVADFDAMVTPAPPEIAGSAEEASNTREALGDEAPAPAGLRLGQLVYAIHLQLPETRDPAVYDALFRSLRAHLLQ